MILGPVPRRSPRQYSLTQGTTKDLQKPEAPCHALGHAPVSSKIARRQRLMRARAAEKDDGLIYVAIALVREAMEQEIWRSRF